MLNKLKEKKELRRRKKRKKGETEFKRKKNFNPFARIVLMYIAIVLLGSLILTWDFLLKDGQSISYIDSLFTSISSFATTGLSVVNITEIYNYYGWITLIIFFNIGGMGIMTINTILFMMIGNKGGGGGGT